METTPQSHAKPENTTAQDLAQPNQSEILAKELMLCLSKEIETTTTNMMAFRTKVGFGMFVGPFLLLGSFIVGAKGQPVSFNLNRFVLGALVVDVVCFLGIAYIAAQIEAQALKQCNKWRGLIGSLRTNPSVEIDSSQLELNLFGVVGMERRLHIWLGIFCYSFPSLLPSSSFSSRSPHLNATS